MDARNEALSLRDNPLPPEQMIATEKDKILPSLILGIDREITKLEQMIDDLRTRRLENLTRAVTLGIGEDEHAIIIVKESLSDREIDVERFKVEKPEIYKKAIDTEIAAEREKIQKKIDALSDTVKTIRIATLKALLGEDDITALSVPRKITPTYQVQSVKVPIPKGKGIKLLSEVQP